MTRHVSPGLMAMVVAMGVSTHLVGANRSDVGGVDPRPTSRIEDAASSDCVAPPARVEVGAALSDERTLQ